MKKPMNCKKCSSQNGVRNGFIRGHQRFKCKDCGCVYTETKPRGKSLAMKALALVLYTIGNASFGMIGRILGVSNVAVLKWIRNEAKKLPEPSVSNASTLTRVAFKERD